ncbi:hypothetical protein PHJA_002743400 [Phtheirospermum japonicum]|uniref:RING-type domain-containing protein n=1 Tax=Phtheirospermum japonicum TaxID=374723 RepID=A0A830DDA3_9LAMI|nr:hypothetical protein PHJA_002743400 [Phtheirospermum japonicum]
MGGGASGKLKKAAKKILTLQTCGGSLCLSQQQIHVSPVSRDSRNYSSSSSNQKSNIISSEIAEQGNSTTSPSSNKSLCAICLDPLNYNSGSKAIFTAQCSHAFHFACITSNVRHGGVTCPICRARWTQLPRNLNTPCPLHNTPDPALQMLDNSIAHSRVRQRSFFRSPQFEPDHTTTDQPRLSFSLLTHPSNGGAHYYYLRVKLAHQPATDLVLVVSPCGRAHSSLVMKQAMALVVSSLRPIDRLAIVTCPSPNAHACNLRHMTSHGKRAALKIINQILYTAGPQAEDPMGGLEKGVKALGDRAHGSPRSCILHLTNDPSRSYYNHRRLDSDAVPVTIHQFDLGACSGYVMREFEEFLARTLGGRAEDIQMRVGGRESNMVVRIGEMRGGEERNIRLCGGDVSGRVCVKYSYRDGRDGECVRTGDVVVGIEGEDKGDGIDSRNYCAGNWDYQDSFMARRWG